MAGTLHDEKRAVNPLMKSPLTFLSDWEQSALMILKSTSAG
jgi:hypothetical protein